MNLTKILTSLFGNKSTRDMKLIQPLVEKVKAVYPEIQKLDNDQLRQRTRDIQKRIQESAKEQKQISHFDIHIIQESFRYTTLTECRYKILFSFDYALS